MPKEFTPRSFRVMATGFLWCSKRSRAPDGGPGTAGGLDTGGLQLGGSAYRGSLSGRSGCRGPTVGDPDTGGHLQWSWHRGPTAGCVGTGSSQLVWVQSALLGGGVYVRKTHREAFSHRGPSRMVLVQGAPQLEAGDRSSQLGV